MDTPLPPTEKQVNYVRALQRSLHIPDSLLDNHCVSRFGHPFVAADRGEVSALIDELARWTEKPAEMRRAQGQQDLPGMSVAL